MTKHFAGRHASLALLLSSLAVAGCGSETAGTTSAEGRDRPVLSISAIPDQDPEELARLYPVVADELSSKLGVEVRYRPVTDYAASVTAFKTGDLDLVWFGGLTGVQATTQVPGARALAQRDIDANFHSVFVANAKSGVGTLDGVADLGQLRDKRFTFGSESSTSGRVMPEYFLERAGVERSDFRGDPGFSGSHDKTIALVESGSYDAGVLNEAVWKDRIEAGEVDRSKIRQVLRTPAYHDYFWVGRPDLDERFGDGFSDKVGRALLSLDGSTERQRKILELFGAERFIEVGERDHDEVRDIARELGLLDEAGA